MAPHHLDSSERLQYLLGERRVNDFGEPHPMIPMPSWTCLDLPGGICGGLT